MAHTLTKEVKSIFNSLRSSSRSRTPERSPHSDKTTHEDNISSSMTTSNNLGPSQPQPSSNQCPILIELFQSQGCNSCPPTNDNLISFIQARQSSSSGFNGSNSPPRFYANRSSSPSPSSSASTSPTSASQEYLLLTYQVTYWNYLGWDDTFSLPGNDARQRDYVRHMRLKSAYTPMVVVNGRGVGVGNTQSDLNRILRDGTAPRQTAQVKMTKILDDMDVSALQIEIDATATSTSQSSALEIYEVKYTPVAQDVHISRGENAGRTLSHLNVVKEVKRLGYLERGAKARFTVQGPGRSRTSQVEGRVLVVQDGRGGEVVGVLRI
jgi:hypothetical protein